MPSSLSRKPKRKGPREQARGPGPNPAPTPFCFPNGEDNTGSGLQGQDQVPGPNPVSSSFLSWSKGKRPGTRPGAWAHRLLVSLNSKTIRSRDHKTSCDYCARIEISSEIVEAFNIFSNRLKHFGRSSNFRFFESIEHSSRNHRKSFTHGAKKHGCRWKSLTFVEIDESPSRSGLR